MIHDFYRDWSIAKKDAKLDDKLFTLKLGPKLDDLNKQYIALSEATRQANPRL